MGGEIINFFKCPKHSNFSVFYNKEYIKPPRTPSVSDPLYFYPILILSSFPFYFLPFSAPLLAWGTDPYILGPPAIWLLVGSGQWEELAGISDQSKEWLECSFPVQSVP